MIKFSRAVVVLLVAGCCAVGAEPKLLSWKLLDDGWISLLDGQTLYGWQPVGDAKWAVVDGEIRTSGEKPGWLMTTTRWADYELHVEFKADPKTNSGVFLRSALKPTDPTKDCYEVNIAPRDNPFPTGSLVGRKKCLGVIASNGSSLTVAKPLRVWDGKWHSLDVRVDGDTFSVNCDGGMVLNYRDSRPIRIGHIGLQSHEGPVAFRNLRLRPTGLKPLFDGHDLNGWSLVRTKKSKFTVTKNGELHLSHGPGQIETDQDFANFVLQLECKVNGKELNSGIFFRALRNRADGPGTRARFRMGSRTATGRSRRITARGRFIVGKRRDTWWRTIASGSRRRSWPMGRILRSG